jgi:hypothetical protein
VLHSYGGNPLPSGEPGQRTNTDQISRSDLQSISLADSGPQSGSDKDSDVIFHIDAGVIENKESALHNVHTSNTKYYKDDETWNAGEGYEEDKLEYENDEVHARKGRSPQDFDDVVESSEEKDNKKGGDAKGRGKGKSNGKGQGRGRGKSA